MARRPDSALDSLPLLKKPRLGLSLFHLPARQLQRILGEYSSKIFRLRSCTAQMKAESSFSRWRITLAAPNTGILEFKSANKLLEPTCETHATHVWGHGLAILHPARSGTLYRSRESACSQSGLLRLL